MRNFVGISTYTDLAISLNSLDTLSRLYKFRISF